MASCGVTLAQTPNGRFRLLCPCALHPPARMKTFFKAVQVRLGDKYLARPEEYDTTEDVLQDSRRYFEVGAHASA